MGTKIEKNDFWTFFIWKTIKNRWFLMKIMKFWEKNLKNHFLKCLYYADTRDSWCLGTSNVFLRSLKKQIWKIFKIRKVEKSIIFFWKIDDFSSNSLKYYLKISKNQWKYSKKWRFLIFFNFFEIFMIFWPRSGIITKLILMLLEWLRKTSTLVYITVWCAY